MIGWWKRRRRARLVAGPFESAWRDELAAYLAFWSSLSQTEQEKLEKLIQVFVGEKTFEGCNGLVVTDAIKRIIAAQACRLLLGFDENQHDYYPNVRTILVYPRSYFHTDEQHESDGTITVGPRSILGEAHYRGPVVLSWHDLQHGAANDRDGHNLVYHEFAHKLDMLDGYVNGTPPLPNKEDYPRWAEVMTREFKRLQRQTDRGAATVLDAYGLTDEGEFFAVATEAFFERSNALRRRCPALYELMRDYYRQDPADR